MATIMAPRSGVLVPVLLDDADAARLPSKVSVDVSTGYAKLWVDGRMEFLHRWVLGLAPRDGKIGDHINRDRLDCRRVNLRATTWSGNSANVRARGISGFRGVYPQRNGRWMARGNRPNYGGAVHLGTYDSAEEAAAVAHAWRIANLPGYIPDTRQDAGERTE